jgi:hypothetical protein
MGKVIPCMKWKFMFETTNQIRIYPDIPWDTIYHPLMIFNWDIACDKQGGIQWDQIIYLQWTYHDISYLQSGGSMNDYKSLVYYDYMYITEHRCDIPSSKDAGNTI